MTITLPNPVFAPAGRDYDGKPSRSRKVDFFVPGAETPTERGVDRLSVQVHVGHSTNRKAFYATVNRVTHHIEPGSPFSSVSEFPFDAATLARQPVARYSAKALESFLAEVIANFQAQVEASPKVQAFFTDTIGERP